MVSTTLFARVKTDTQVKHNGERLNVKIISADGKVTSTYPGEAATNTLSLNPVSEIIFSTGRIQKRTEKIVVNGKDDWEKVIIALNPDDVKDIVRKGEVRSTANNTWGFKGKMSPDKKAIMKIKKATAELRNHIILIQEQVKTNTTFVTGGSSSKYGVAYVYQ